jgi:hypothetical protein
MPVTLDPEEILTRLFGSVSRARILQFLLSHAGSAFYQEEELGSHLQMSKDLGPGTV